MSHSVVVNLIADQTLFIRGQEINIHDLESITLDGGGCIIAFRLKALGGDMSADTELPMFQIVPRWGGEE